MLQNPSAYSKLDVGIAKYVAEAWKVWLRRLYYKMSVGWFIASFVILDSATEYYYLSSFIQTEWRCYSTTKRECENNWAGSWENCTWDGSNS